jgi:hypothetical protein
MTKTGDSSEIFSPATGLTSDLTERMRRLEDHKSAQDVLYRFAEGQDRRDRALLRSAFTEDAELDFAQPAQRFGVSLTPFQGREAIVSTVLTNIAPLHTSHTVTNQRICIDGDFAAGTALVEAQHVNAENPDSRLLLKNFYDFELRRNHDGWAMSRVVIRNIWFEGTSTVLFPA